jgi:subtilisin family serine protease
MFSEQMLCLTCRTVYITSTFDIKVTERFLKYIEMATVYIIASEADRTFLERQVLPVLPCNGYSHWLTSYHLTRGAGDKNIAWAMNQCQAIITVVSKNLLQSPVFILEIDITLKSKTTNIIVQIEALDDKSIIPTQLWALPLIDLTLEKQTDLKATLVALLPPQTQNETIIPYYAHAIDWGEEIFSQNLQYATIRHDHASAQWLISMLSYHITQLSAPYSTKSAIADMQILRKEREFGLMRTYGNAVINSGTTQDKVLRLYAQALIETKEYDAAMKVLNSILTDPDSSISEIFEAQGLIGRIYKQLYMNNPDSEGSASLLRLAIKAYGTAYLENKSNFWHGVNTASCIRRLERDGNDDPDFSESPRDIAEQIVYDLDQQSAKEPLEVWDCASKVEALIVLERYKEAERALEVYIHHPDMTAFEVSSTYRQFGQVLQLGEIPEGFGILIRLRNTMERYRAGTVLTSSASTSKSGQAQKDDESILKSLTIRISDPFWSPQDIPGLTIQSRMDKIITARGSNKIVRQLLEEPMVISVEASRPAGLSECNRSLPYIKVGGQYTSPVGNYEETGGLALIAIIDDSIDVLHKAFLDANGNSRIEGVWDQTDESGTAPLGFNYGTFHSKTAITGYIQTQLGPPNLGRNGLRHGTHVASIAAGRGVGSFAGGVAEDAKLLVVIPNNNGSIGYSNSFIDALSYIDKFATDIKLPVVVNVSQGMNAGAHDGKSSLEAAFDAFSGSGRKAGRVVVKSAGNERDQAGHAKVTLLTGAVEDLPWVRIKGADATERIELWWSSADEVRFRLREPLNPLTINAGLQPNWSDWLGTANPECSGTFSNGGGPYYLIYTKRHVDNGDSLLVIELGQDINAIVPAGLGEWMLEIEGIEIKGNGEIHCWIERGQGGTPTSFQPPHVSEEMTLSVPGTAETVITVGAIDASKPIRLGKSSSYGPTRDNGQKPQVCAPGVNVVAADAGTSDGVFSDSGTSMAAPHVTGAIALLLSRVARLRKTVNANQISKALSQKTQNYNGNWDRGQGFGVIDVSAFLAAFE